MNDAISPLEFYQQKINSLEQQLAALYKRKSTIAWIRFAIFIATCLAVYFVWGNGLMLIIITVICGIALFLIAVSKDVDNKDNIKNLETLLSINKDELNYLQQNFSEKFNGKMFEPHQHPYAKDLDVFGPASLFQYINRCNAEQATQLLANRLLTPLSKQSILQQQSTVKAIRAKINWWQQFQAHAIDEKITTASEKRISEWLSMEDKVFVHAKWKLLAYIFPFITLGCVVMYLADILPSAIFSFLVLIFFLISLMITGKIQKLYELLSRLEPVVSTLYMQLHHFEKEHFDDTFLSKLKTSLGGSTDKTASASIKHLQNILSRFDARLNAFAFFILNTLFLWDLWQIIALNNWKKANKTLATNWFNAIAQLEVAGSFATLSFNNPQWYFPAIADEHFTLSGKNIGHPLIAAKQVVTNDFQINGISKIDLVTGSNMAGKSTFLRSIGVNMILAYAGSPVHADSFTVSVAHLMSSMRIEDNLAENTSTFYAELKKLKLIIDAVNAHEKVFILLDEILRGTNSLDRHAGSKALIQQLVKKDAVAIIATHDIELSKLEHDFPNAIENYHFDVAVNNDKLFFDYKLKHGICQSMNASILMKQIGIEV